MPRCGICEEGETKQLVRPLKLEIPKAIKFFKEIVDDKPIDFVYVENNITQRLNDGTSYLDPSDNIINMSIQLKNDTAYPDSSTNFSIVNNPSEYAIILIGIDIMGVSSYRNYQAIVMFGIDNTTRLICNTIEDSNFSGQYMTCDGRFMRFDLPMPTELPESFNGRLSVKYASTPLLRYAIDTILNFRYYIVKKNQKDLLLKLLKEWNY